MMNRRFATGLALSFATLLAPAAAWSAEVVGIGGKCLDVRAQAKNDGAAVVLATCNRSPSQNWQLADGLVRVAGGKCLDVRGGEPTDGTALVLWTCHGRANQRWAIR
jgi:Ricin-type beta-trefoil lectin domain